MYDRSCLHTFPASFAFPYYFIRQAALKTHARIREITGPATYALSGINRNAVCFEYRLEVGSDCGP
jgi:hypothetical protein